jgi:simple sugar transport system permease protein
MPLALIAAAAAAIAASGLLFVAMGYPAGRTLDAFFLQPFETLNGWSELALKAAPLLTIALGLVACFRANVWNIGADGQFTIGAASAGAVALAFGSQGSPVALPLMIVAGIAGGVAWAAVPALLRTAFGASEILTSLMLSYVAGLVLATLVFGPLKDPLGYNYPQSAMFADDATLAPIVAGTRVTAGTLACLALPFVGAWLLGRTVPGFGLRVFGEAPAAARFAGFSQGRTVWTAMAVSGGLAGLAGCLEVAGPIGQLIPAVSPGYGFTAIIVAFLGRLHPLGIIPASLLMAVSYVGGDLAQVAVGLPKGATGVVQAMLLFFVLAADVLGRRRTAAA